MCDGTLLLRSQRSAGPSKIESHPIDSDPRAGLIDLLAQNVFQRALQQMCRRVMAPYFLPPPLQNARAHLFPDRDLAGEHGAVMRDRFAQILRVANVEARSFGNSRFDRSAVTDLSAALGIE